MICPYDIDLPGGVQNQVIGMAKSLSRDHELTILAPGTTVPQQLYSSSVETKPLGPSIKFRANGSVAPISLSPSAAARLLSYVVHTQPDVLIIHEPMVPLIGLTALFGTSRMKIGVFHRAGPT